MFSNSRLNTSRSKTGSSPKHTGTQDPSSNNFTVANPTSATLLRRFWRAYWALTPQSHLRSIWATRTEARVHFTYHESGLRPAIPHDLTHLLSRLREFIILCSMSDVFGSFRCNYPVRSRHSQLIWNKFTLEIL